MGEALRSTFRDEDVPCRFGGEEFVVVLPGATAGVAERRAEEIRAKIEAVTVRYTDTSLPRVTISIGVASYPHCGSTPTEVLKAADEALYVAKREGRNRVQLSPNLVGGQRPELAALDPASSLRAIDLPCCSEVAHMHVAAE